MKSPIILLAAGLCLTLAQPAPAALARQPGSTTAAAGKCMWEQLPQAARAAVLSKATIDGVFAELNVQITALGNGAMIQAGRTCGVGPAQFRSAGSRVADWAGRLWSEKQLAGRASPQKLDQAYRAMAAADKQAFHDSLETPGGLQQSPAKEALDRYLGSLGIRRTEQPAYVAAVNYLISRLNDER
ncbi:MAG TPA: hypothetical protein VEA44_18955 [Caulobacter sp.]|nr:hypothetical protein [Caulobacter sp.]